MRVTPEIADHISELWADQGVKNTFQFRANIPEVRALIRMCCHWDDTGGVWDFVLKDCGRQRSRATEVRFFFVTVLC